MLQPYILREYDMCLGTTPLRIGKGWDLTACAEMLIEIIEASPFEQVVAVGQSWGSMTILRAAVKRPDLFRRLGFANMPLDAGNLWKSITYAFQSIMLPFRRFYSKQAAKILFAADSLQQHPEFYHYLYTKMRNLTLSQLIHTDKRVVISPDSGFDFINQLQVPALAVKGEFDYVPVPGPIALTVIPGGHISPLEAPTEFKKWFDQLLDLDAN
jgi:pimeloyl-ACP methyl ester carboxylesterase